MEQRTRFELLHDISCCTMVLISASGCCHDDAGSVTRSESRCASRYCDICGALASSGHAQPLASIFRAYAMVAAFGSSSWCCVPRVCVDEVLYLRFFSSLYVGFCARPSGTAVCETKSRAARLEAL